MANWWDNGQGEYLELFWDDINATVNGNNQLRAATAGKRIAVKRMEFTCAATMTVGISSDANVIIAAQSFAQHGGPFVLGNPVRTNEGEELRIVTNNVGPVVGWYEYTLEED